MTGGPVAGPDGRPRCPWAIATPDYVAYHDEEWGRPVRGDDALFERLSLEAFQSGLSWLTILRKREAFRAAFAGFSIERVAAFGDEDVERLTLEAFQSGLSWLTILRKREAFREVFAGFDADVVAAFGEDDEARLMADPRIVRNRLKVAAAVTNARATVALRERGGLSAFVESFAPAVSPSPATTEEMQTTSPESLALSKALKKQGFVFVGPTTMYALMEAVGLVDDHLVGCHRRGSAG